MKTLTEVSKLVGMTRRVIQEYEAAGLSTTPKTKNKNGYLLYDDHTIQRLMQIRFYREIGYDKKQIMSAFNDPDFNMQTALSTQIRELEKKKTELERIIDVAKSMHEAAINPIDVIAIASDANFDLALMTMNTLAHSIQESTNDSFDNELFYDEEISDDDAELWWVIVEHLSTLRNLDFTYSSKESQEQIESLHALYAKQLGDSILFFTNILLEYARGSETAKMLDEEYGEGLSDYIYKAIKCYCDTNKNNSTDQEVFNAINAIEKLGRNRYKTTSDEVQAEVAKIHHFYSKARLLTYKGQLYSLRTLGNWCNSQEMRMAVDNGAEHGIAWFISRAIEIYCNHHENSNHRE